MLSERGAFRNCVRLFGVAHIETLLWGLAAGDTASCGRHTAAAAAACQLDLALHLLHHLCISGQADKAIAWAAALPDDVARVPRHKPARRVLLEALDGFPALAAVLWLTCAHVLAWGTLPDIVTHR